MKKRDGIDTSGYTKLILENDSIPQKYYEEFDVKRGLRDQNGKGVLAGLTSVSNIVARDPQGNPCDGQLWYRGYRIEELIKKYMRSDFGYENLAYLLLFGDLASPEESKDFIATLEKVRELPTNFTRDVIMKAPTKDIMNSMTRAILTLASYDRNAIDTSLENVVSQCIQLIAVFRNGDQSNRVAVVIALLRLIHGHTAIFGRGKNDAVRTLCKHRADRNVFLRHDKAAVRGLNAVSFGVGHYPF